MAAIRFRSTLAVCLLTCGTLFAAEPREQSGPPVAAELPPVEVGTLRNPVEKSYRRIVRGMDLFERRHALAPNAELRYKLLPRLPDTDMRGIAMNVVGETVAIPVPVAADGTFALGRDPQALREDAMVVPNRRARSMTWRTDIRTPGLPPNTRRLGDLRLECMVGMEAGLVSNVRPFFGQIASFLMRLEGYCEHGEVLYLFFADRPLFGVTLVSGNRRESMPVDQLYAAVSRYPDTMKRLEYCDCQVLLARTYYAPVGDASWPDDTLLELDYMDDGQAAATGTTPPVASRAPVAVVTPQRIRAVAADSAGSAVAVGKSTRAAVMAALGETQVIRFDNGFEAWVYPLAETPVRSRPPQGRENGAPDSGEFVVLFAPSGLVSKTRLRQPGDASGSQRG